MNTNVSANIALASAASTMYLFSATINPKPAQDANVGPIGDENIRIINLGPIVNYEGLDYAPTISADGKTLYFVSDRTGSKLDNSGEFSHDFWFCTKEDNYDTVFYKPVNLDTTTTYGNLGVNTALNEGVASISADQQTLVFTGCNRPDGIGDCDLYITEVEGREWGRPRNLGRAVNSEYWDSQPSIAPDKSRIYFASNRPDDNGDDDIDIWYTDFDFEFEEWKPAVNAGESINTDEQDWSPFINADNQTLFFASNGHKPNLGGLDFYLSRRDDADNWTQPENIGAPINTVDNESFISAPASGDIIYFASTREDIRGFQGSYDIFMAFVPTFFRVQQLTGVVLDECSDENIPGQVRIYNPVTKKTYRDSVDGSGNTTFSMVVNPLDFGDPKDSIMYIDLEITAENPGYGKVTQTLRVEKPEKVKDKSKTQEPIKLEPVVLKLGQRPVLSAEMDFSDYSKANPADPKFGNFKGLVMQEVVTRTLHPLLNYVFFDEGESQIPERYVLFNNKQQVDRFNDQGIPGGTFDKYYNVLNIYGFRMRNNPSAKIKLVGCIGMQSDKEKDQKLAKARADAVNEYLTKVWGIEQNRIEVTHRGLPAEKSNIRDSMGIVENRRVEVICDEWEIVKPVVDEFTVLFPSPEEMTFNLVNGIDDNIVASRRIEVTHGGKPWVTLSKIGKTEKTSTWDWKSAEDGLPEKGDEAAFQAQLIVTSNSGRECVSDPITILVRQISTEELLLEKGKTKTLEKYNLVLFKFDSDLAGPLNERILKEFVYTRVYPSSEIDIVGHTDVVGLYERNLQLSKGRAGTVYNGIKKNRSEYARLEMIGVGEDDPLYTNDLPEGRFYNRTVQVVIQTPLEDVK